MRETRCGWSVRRLPGNPILRPGMGARIGENIQGPSLIRVPAWVSAPLGRYYLYFADHGGDHIRLAVADRLDGPWRVHEPGALSLAESGFLTAPPPRPAGFVAPPPAEGTAPAGTPGVPDAETDATHPHIASPDVHVHDAERRIVMLLHGLDGYARQVTRAAVSADGLRFTVRPEVLGPPYMRAFRFAGAHYALAMPGVLFRSADGLSGFRRGPDLFREPRQRHAAVLRRGRTLFVFWTRVGDAPERVLVSRVALDGDWRGWRADPAEELLRPETPWEGAGLPVGPSWRGAVAGAVNQVRDPAVFEEDGRVFLLYAVQGERGIAIAELTLPA
jgi:hypothetical protein